MNPVRVGVPLSFSFCSLALPLNLSAASTHRQAPKRQTGQNEVVCRCHTGVVIGGAVYFLRVNVGHGSQLNLLPPSRVPLWARTIQYC